MRTIIGLHGSDEHRILKEGGKKTMEAMEILAGLAPMMAALGVFFAGLGVLMWGSKTNRD